MSGMLHSRVLQSNNLLLSEVHALREDLSKMREEQDAMKSDISDMKQCLSELAQILGDDKTVRKKMKNEMQGMKTDIKDVKGENEQVRNILYNVTKTHTAMNNKHNIELEHVKSVVTNTHARVKSLEKCVMFSREEASAENGGKELVVTQQMQGNMTFTQHLTPVTMPQAQYIPLMRHTFPSSSLHTGGGGISFSFPAPPHQPQPQPQQL